MRIVQQSVPLSYSPFLALPAPKIAGLLPAPKPPAPPKPFVFDDPHLADLSVKSRAQLDMLLTTLIKATVGLLTDAFSETAFELANATFARQIKALYQGAMVGEISVASSPFAQSHQRLYEKIEAMTAQSKVHLAEARERIARELAARPTMAVCDE